MAKAACLSADTPAVSPCPPQAIFTLLPLRVGLALLAAGRALLSRAPPPTTPGSVAGSPTACGGLPRPLQQLRGDQLFDLLGAGMSLGVVVFLWNLNAGTLYFWMKVGGGWLCGLFFVALCCCRWWVHAVLERVAPRADSLRECKWVVCGWRLSRRPPAALPHLPPLVRACRT